ncbi:hypothetical protein OG453_07600 [Streptomyces sp. NBC_01381]|uniref:hypothetical protein n=1 Tax=Streptomyces sp. NBC_01381 TaxID=2903845 RepID=UPI002257B22C|nr:hypothetical protein [Streptomyces sp. NBC_01381]MCX4666534.1 hypothetical protein [Streptomyces sp. NBC_01381]
MLDTLAATAVGASSAAVGILVGAVVTRRAQGRQLRDQRLAAYQALFSHYSKFMLELRQAHADRRDCDYDWGEWSSALMSASLVTPAGITKELDNFTSTVEEFVHRATQECAPALDPLSAEDFEDAQSASARAQLALMNAVRRSLSRGLKGLPSPTG